MPSLTANSNNSDFAKMWANTVAVVAAGAFIVVDARGMTVLSVITGGGTATVSRVDIDGAVADSGDTAANASVAAATKLSITVDWPFYRIGAVTAPCRVACV